MNVNAGEVIEVLTSQLAQVMKDNAVLKVQVTDLMKENEQLKGAANDDN
jgi:hypothetical protein